MSNASSEIDRSDIDEDKSMEESNSLNVTYEELSLPNKKRANENSNSDSRLLFNEPDAPINTNQNENLLSMNFNSFNNLNDDMSDSGYMNRNFETNLEEIFDNLNYFLTSEKQQVEKERDNLNKTIQSFIDFNSVEVTKLEKEKEKWKTNVKIASDMNIKSDDIIDLDIGGTCKLSTSRQTLMKYPNSSLAKFFAAKSEFQLHNGRVFIDRDGTAFMNMLSFLRNKKLPFFKDAKTQQSFYEELDYWQIPLVDTFKNKSGFTFDPDWCAATLRIEPSMKVIKKRNVQHGIVFCRPVLDGFNRYIEFKITIKKRCKGKSHLFIGIVDKSKYKYENLISTFWRDSPSSFYWDTWNTKLIKTDENGLQAGSTGGYGCQCESDETFLSMKYNANDKTLSFYKNAISLGVAFHNVPSGLTPSLDIWFEEGSVEIMNSNDIEVKDYL